ncbi:site-specific integrase [Kribbella yunnanensis]|uniref:Site-specific integrase n=1 Tax=Kribbella yunnanensis TaxID=190194 RepID=A0ABN2H156_9ACTN
MSTRKPNLRSSIYQSDTDGRWHGWVTMGVKSDGSPDRRHRVGSSEPEVTRKVRKLEQERDAGKTSKPGRKPTVAEWMTTYLETICARLVATGKMSPGTLNDYHSLNRVWIIPQLGKHRLDRLLPEHLDELYAAMAAAGRAESSVLKVHAVVRRALEVAHRRDKVGRNIAKLIDAPAGGDSEIKPLTQAEARQLLATAANRRTGTRWALGLALGLRQGEGIGLRWEYVDLEAGAVRVWWQLQRSKWQHGCADPVACSEPRHRQPCPADCPKAQRTSGRRHRCVAKDAAGLCKPGCKGHASTCPERRGGGLVFRPPKGKSKRTVPLPPELVPMLRSHRVAQNAERLAAGAVWEDYDLVFCRPDGRPIDPRRDWDDWKQLLAAAGVRDARVHDGRHTAGTVLLEMGVHIRTVQEILGHSDIRVTQRYTHVASPMAQDAAQQMGRALWGGTR